MKNSKRFLSGVLALLMFMSVSSISLFAYAEGTGSEDNPYRISTAKELQDINNNLTAYYILVNDIDLSGIDFEPIGNAETGTFQGVFDGNGYTISNLDVYAGKYAGLFGCNEGGTIKNLKLNDIYIFGNRYIGSIVAYNSCQGVITNCIVNSGVLEIDQPLNTVYVGGICGYTTDSYINDCQNRMNIEVNLYKYKEYSYGYLGGIVGGCENNSTIKGCINYGNLSSEENQNSYYSGGIIGKGGKNILIENCVNYGTIYAWSMAGGIIAYSIDSNIVSCRNEGIIRAVHNIWTGDSYAGGIVGYNSFANINLCSNHGKVYAYAYENNSYTGGLVGYAYKIDINQCYNDGYISGRAGKVGGLIGYINIGKGSILKNSYNTAFIRNTADSYGRTSGLVGEVYNNPSNFEASNCFQTGVVRDFSNGYSYCYSIINTEFINSYALGYIYDKFDNYYSYINSFSSEYCDWDFDNIWNIDFSLNSGHPVLKGMENALYLNYSYYDAIINSKLQLKAYRNGIIQDDINWSVTYGDANILDDGVVEFTSTGPIVITAEDYYGNKSNCTIFVSNENNKVDFVEQSINVNETKQVDVELSNKSYDHIINAYCTDSNIAIVQSYYDNTFTIKGISAGTTQVTVETLQGLSSTKNITVTNYAKRISLSSSSLTVARGETQKLTATTSPSPTSSTITWKSSNSDVATVNQNGNVTGVSIGSSTITAETDNGYSATCSVTVNAPVTSMEFVQPSVSVYKGYTVQLNVVTDPTDTTDAITYSSSSTTIATVSTSGVVTAKATGTATITATSTSGKKAYCAITVLAAPVVATDLTLGDYSKDMLIGELYTLSATITPSTATDKTVIWQTTNSDIVDVSETGVLTAKGAGKAVVSATTSSGITKYCVVNVAGVSDGAIARIFVPNISQTGVDYIDVPVIIENNPGISFASISVGYDSNELEPIDVTNGTVFDSVTGSFDTDNSVVKLYFTSEENKTADGNLAIIRFRVINTGAVETIVSVAYMPGGITNNAEEAVAFNLADGRVETELCIHENTEVRNAKTATCTEQGYTGDIYCLDCGDLLETGTIIDIKPHNYQTTVFEPTENKQGYTKYVCTDCGYSYVGDITDYASDNSALIAVLETIANYSEEDYSADSFANLQAIYNQYSSMATGSYAQIEIDNAIFDLLTAISELEPYLNLNISAPNGAFTVTYNDETNSNIKHSLLFGTDIALTATANEGYEFVGWYDTVNNLYFSKNPEYSFKLTTNTSLKAVFVKEQSATLTFTTYSNWVQSTVTKTIDEWNSVSSIDDLLPAVPYKYGYSNGRWVYDNAEVLAKLQTGENVSLIPEYDEDDTSLPTPPSPKGDTPVLDLYYKLDADANVGSFVMAAGIPKDCKLESVGIAFYYKNADEFDPTKFELLINNKMLAGRFNTDEIEDIYIVNMNKMSANYNWAARGYVTYYDSDGNLKTVYSNQINIVNREQV